MKASGHIISSLLQIVMIFLSGMIWSADLGTDVVDVFLPDSQGRLCKVGLASVMELTRRRALGLVFKSLMAVLLG